MKTQRERVGVKSITIDRAEGLHHEVGQPVTLNDWQEANAALWIMSESAPAHGGYNKTDFTITFENDETYTGRYDLKHHSVERPDLKRHVRDFVRYSAGVDCPAHMTHESWQEYLKAVEHYNPGTREAFKKLYDDYDVGFEDAPEPEEAEQSLYAIQEYAPRPDGDYRASIIVAEHRTLQEAAEDVLSWNEANPMCGYAIVKVNL